MASPTELKAVPRTQAQWCSFCGKDDSEAEQVISGVNNVGICNECVDLCVSMITEPRQHGLLKAKMDEHKRGRALTQGGDEPNPSS